MSSKVFTCFLMVSFVLLACFECSAGTKRQKALAAVAVAKAALDIAAEQPALPDTTNRFSQSLPLPPTPLTEAELNAAEERFKAISRRDAESAESAEKNKEAEIKETIVPARIVPVPVDDKSDKDGDERRRLLRLELDAAREELASAKEQVQTQAWTIAELKAARSVKGSRGDETKTAGPTPGETADEPKLGAPQAVNATRGVYRRDGDDISVDSENVRSILSNAAVWKPDDEKTPHPGPLPGVSGRREKTPMKFEMAKVAQISDVIPAQLVIGCWESGCPAGKRLKNDIMQTLTPLKWSIGSSSTDQIQFVTIPRTRSCPEITLFQNGNVIKTSEGYTDPSVLSHALRKAWDESPTPQFATTMAAGPAGAIQCSGQIRQAMSLFRDRIGVGNKAEFRWDRSGAQSFPLLAHGDWSALAVCGAYGHVQLSAPNAINLPLKELGFGYRVDGDDISIDLDRITMKGLGLELNPSHPQAMGATPAGFDPLTMWTIVTVIRDLWSLLHPTCDLQLGGNVTATAVLNGDMLSIEFQQCPSIKLVALFTFQLQVNRVEITEQSVRVLFGGSRLVKERTFSVK